MPKLGPYCTIIGGPNGSGKSTIFSLLEPTGEFINADVIARRINPIAPERASLAAGKVVLETLREVVAERKSFVYETTLSSHQSVALMAACKAAGYEIALVFVTLDRADLNVRRVAERVAQGGHDIPEIIIRRRYEAAFARLPSAIRLADQVLLFDNSELRPELLVMMEFGEIVHNHLSENSSLHRRLLLQLGKALG